MELLIVIAVIGILVSISTVAYTSAQKKTRDSRRRSDLKAIQSAMEQYYADNNGSYPAGCSPGTTYLPNGVPADPKSGSYVSSCTTSSYCFCATLESDPGNATNTSCSYGSGTYYCVSQRQ